MAGGSADGAAALLACDTLWGTGSTHGELLALCTDPGSGVPFSLVGGAALVAAGVPGGGVRDALMDAAGVAVFVFLRRPWNSSHTFSNRDKFGQACRHALVGWPSLLLKDGPFGSLDAGTHDIDESVYVGDRVVVLSAGPGSRVTRDLPIALPGDRDQITTCGSPGLVALRTEVGRAVRGAPRGPRGGPK